MADYFYEAWDPTLEYPVSEPWDAQHETYKQLKEDLEKGPVQTANWYLSGMSRELSQAATTLMSENYCWYDHETKLLTRQNYDGFEKFLSEASKD